MRNIYNHWDDNINQEKKYSKRKNWKNLFISEKFALSYLDSKVKSILDVGCGTGELYEVFKDMLSNEISYTGIDISKKTINIAINRYPKINFIKGNFLNLKNNNKYDLVFSTGVIQHEALPYELIKKCISKSKNLIIFDLKIITKTKSIVDINFSYSDYKSKTFYNLINITELVEKILNFKGIREIIIFGYRSKPNKYVVVPNTIDIDNIYAANFIIKKGKTKTVKLTSIIEKKVNDTLKKKMSIFKNHVECNFINFQLNI